MIKFNEKNKCEISSHEERELELSQQINTMQEMQVKLDAYTKQQTYDYQTAKSMLTEIQQLYRIYEAEDFFGTTSSDAIIH